MTHDHKTFLLMAVSLLVCISAIAVAQVTTANLVGTVTDAAGAALPNAVVSVQNLGTNETRTVNTTASGDYVINLLKPGHYSVRVELRGFKTFAVADLVLGAGDNTRQNAEMQAGDVTETINVSARSSELQTESSAVQAVVGEKSVQDLPLTGRNFIGLVQIQPGINPGPPRSIAGGTRPDDRRQSSAFSANGQSDLYNSSQIDGLDNNERQQGFTAVRPSIDGIAEVRVLTNNYTAEVGRPAGAIVNIITKSGANQFHGSAFEYFRNDIFDARDFFALTKPKHRQNQFGGSFGGPVIKNKTFFFFDVEESRIIKGLTFTTTVPTLFQRQNPGNFSDVGGPVLPAAAISPIGLQYFNLYPLPNRPGTANNYTSSPNSTQFGTVVGGRVDHRFGNNDSMFARYSYNPVSSFIPGAFPQVNGIEPGGAPFLFPGPSKTTAQGINLDYTHIFSPNLLMQLKAGYTRLNIKSLPLNYDKPLANQFGIGNANIATDPTASGGLTPFTGGQFTGLGDGVCCVPIFNINNVYQINGALTYTHGAHNLKFGGAMIRRQLNFLQSPFPLGIYILATAPPLFNPFANFLAGFPTITQRSNVLFQPQFRMAETSAFVQDDWRVRPWLTLNLGVRYDVFTPAREKQNKLSNFDPASLKILLAGVSTSSTLGVKTDYNNFAPRLGFAATLRKDWVVRGGFGISYYPGDIQGFIGSGNPPFVSGFSALLRPLSAGFPAPVAVDINTIATNPNVTGLSHKSPDLRPAPIYQTNLFVQRQLGGNVLSVGYVGQFGRDLLSTLDLNRPDPVGPVAPGTAAPALIYRTQLPFVTGIGKTFNGGRSNYNAMQVTFVRRYNAGLTFNANYTWAHGLSNVVNPSGTTNPFGLLARNLDYDYGSTDIDIRHRIAFSASYELPFGKTMTGGKALLLKGWQVNTIAYYQSGQPFTVTESISPGGAYGINLPNVTTDRPNVVASYGVSNPSLNQWFNTAAFRAPALGTVGGEGRNELRGPHDRRWDVSFFKEFRLKEGLKLQFRTEIFNVTNTANFAVPNSTIVGYGANGAPLTTNGFGTISSTALNEIPRQFQFALKLLF